MSTDGASIVGGEAAEERSLERAVSRHRERVTMWEARAAEGQLDALLEYVMATAPDGAEIYRGEQDQVVVIDPSGVGIGEVPRHLVAREPHVWRFTPVIRRG